MCTIPFLIIISWYLWGLFLKEILNFIKACDMHYKVSNHLIYVRINIEMWFRYKFDTTMPPQFSCTHLLHLKNTGVLFSYERMSFTFCTMQLT